MARRTCHDDKKRKASLKKIENESWAIVGKYLRQSMFEVGNSFGDGVAEHVIELSGDPKSLLPDPRALKFLTNLSPTVVEEVMERAKQIQEARLKSARRKLWRIR